MLRYRTGAPPQRIRDSSEDESQGEGELQEEDPRDTTPIEELQGIPRDTPDPIREIVSRSRINDLAVAEKAYMRSLQVGRNPCGRADYAAPNAVHIIRCPVSNCRTPVNTNGVQRAICTHMRQAHPELKDPMKIAVIRFHQTQPQVFFHKPTQEGKQRQQEGKELSLAQ